MLLNDPHHGRVHVHPQRPGQPGRSVGDGLDLHEARTQRGVQAVHLVLSVLRIDGRDAAPTRRQLVSVKTTRAASPRHTTSSGSTSTILLSSSRTACPKVQGSTAPSTRRPLITWPFNAVASSPLGFDRSPPNG